MFRGFPVASACHRIKNGACNRTSLSGVGSVGISFSWRTNAKSQSSTDLIFGAFCLAVRTCRTLTCLPTNGFSIKPLKVKLSAGKQEATKLFHPSGGELNAPTPSAQTAFGLGRPGDNPPGSFVILAYQQSWTRLSLLEPTP